MTLRTFIMMINKEKDKVIMTPVEKRIEQRRMQENPEENLNFNEVIKEIKMLTGKETAEYLFYNIDQLHDELDKLNHEMNTAVSFKFKRFKLLRNINRLQLFYILGIFEGLQLLQVQLELIRLRKQLYIITIEQGMEMKIPNFLSQQNLPKSFRYYDPIVQITQNLISNEKRNFLNVQTSLLRHFDKEYAFWSLVGFQKKKEENNNKGVIRAPLEDINQMDECQNIIKKELFP